MNSTALMSVNQRKELLRANLFSFAQACPVEDCNPAECPLYQLRQMKYTERLEWLNALSEEDLAYLTAYHDVCLNLKLTEQLHADNFFP
jgi:hypothetical protein